MRTLAVVIVLLELAAIGFITCEAVWMAVSSPEDLATEGGRTVVIKRLIAWAAFVGFVALATPASGLGELVMVRRDREHSDSPSKGERPMIETCPAPDRILHLPLGKAVGDAESTTLMKTSGLELIRLVIPAGKEIPPHRAPGEITVQCIEGHVAFEHDGHAIDLHAGDLLHLCPQEIHALKGISHSSVLVTRLRLHADELPERFLAT